MLVALIGGIVGLTMIIGNAFAVPWTRLTILNGIMMTIYSVGGILVGTVGLYRAFRRYPKAILPEELAGRRARYERHLSQHRHIDVTFRDPPTRIRVRK
jgi:hypothetical protein